MQKGCGSCLFQGKSRLDKDSDILCLHDGQWHKHSHICNGYREYIEMPPAERTKIANETTSRIEAQKRHQETVGIDKEANRISRSAKNAAWSAIWISIGSLIISIISILVAIFK